MKFKSLKLHLATVFLGLLVPTIASAQVDITEVDLVGNRIEIVNTGSGSIDLSDWWLCNRENGSPVYQQFTNADGSSNVQIDALSTEATGAADLILEAGDVLVLEVGANFLPDAGGEFGLYNTASFGSAAAIEDYVLWGSGVGVRDSVAEAAGIWTNNTALSLTGIDANNTFTLIGDGDQPSGYGVAASSLGTVSSVPEPSSLAILGLCTAGALLRRRRR